MTDSETIKARKAAAPVQADGAEPSSRAPIRMGGVTFRSYVVGVNRYQIRSDDGRLRAWRNYHSHTYSASVDMKTIGTRFQSDLGALVATLKHVKKAKT